MKQTFLKPLICLILYIPVNIFQSGRDLQPLKWDSSISPYYIIPVNFCPENGVWFYVCCSYEKSTFSLTKFNGNEINQDLISHDFIRNFRWHLTFAMLKIYT